MCTIFAYCLLLVALFVSLKGASETDSLFVFGQVFLLYRVFVGIVVVLVVPSAVVVILVVAVFVGLDALVAHRVVTVDAKSFNE